MTRLFKSLLVGLIALSSLLTAANAQTVAGVSQLPADPRFDQRVTVDFPTLDLEMYLKTLGSAVKLQVIGTNLPAVQVSLKFKDVPFRQVWNNVLAIYGLDFILQSNDLVLVGSREAINALKPQTPAATPPAEPAQETRTYTIKSDVAAVRAAVETQIQGVRVSVVGNRLTVTGTAAQQQRVAALLNDIDVAPPAVTPPAEVRQEIRTYTIKSDVAAIRTLLEAQFPGVRISTVGSRLVVTATPDQHARIAALLADADVAPAPPPAPTPPAPVDIRTETVALSYAKAARLADVLQKVVSGTQVSSGTDITPTSTSSTAATPPANPVATSTTLPGATSTAPLTGVSVIADETSNSLIISGPTATVARLLAIIPNLDKPQQLVNVGVRIQEISDAAGRNLGIDWNFGVGNFSGSIVTGALNFVLDATRSLAGLNIGAALNALETQRLSKRVNDSTLTVLNNGTGNIKVGGRIEITSETSGTGSNSGSTTSGLASRTIPYGVEVQVTPSIAPDGNISLETSASVSSVLNPNSTDFKRIDFIDRSAKSTVRIRDGQTILLGSLLQTIEDTSSRGIPFISSIPLLGDAFKTTNTSSEQTQILIVVTVNLIK
jgi:general secretion pathway protein D/type IV pilus assembly protein PilQ